MSNQVLEQLKNEYNEKFNRLQELGEIIANCADIDDEVNDECSHCGEYSESEGLHQSLKDLLGMEVIGVGGKQTRCLGCPNVHNGTDCVKVELVGGTYLCLAKPQQDEKTVISFDDDESEEGLGDIMKRIEEATEVFMDYLDSVTKKEEQ